MKYGILYHHQKLYGFDYEHLVLPVSRRAEVTKLAHDTAGCHLGAKKTKEKIKFSFTWPTIASDVQRVCECCHQCQKRRRSTVYGRTPITPIPRDEVSFNCLLMDCLGPLMPSQKVEFSFALAV